VSQAQTSQLRPDAAMWGIHGGRAGEADDVFVGGEIAIGWNAMTDLTTLTPTRDAFKAEFQRVYPNAKPGAVSTMAGQPYRFVHEIQIGDAVAYPSKKDREIHLGVVTGPYRWAGANASYPHRRSATWLTSVPRTHFSQAALYEIGSAMTLFQIKNNVEEYLGAISGNAAAAPVVDDEAVAEVAEDFETNTEDFILKRLSRDAKGHPLEDFVAALLEAMGYHTRGVPPGPDGGVDILASRDELGAEPPLIKVQVKSSDSKTGDPEVSALVGKVKPPSEFGIVVSLSGFTPPARTSAAHNSNVRLIDGPELVKLVLAHYDDLDPAWKARLPLKQVWRPDPAS
jgi:restriction system protein